MEKRIELEKRGREPNTIVDLNLDNCRSTSIVGLSDEFTNLQKLSLVNVGLTSLKGFPKLPNLKKLELSDNRISNGLNLLTTSPKLAYLNLSGNKIKDLDALAPLEELKHLKYLDLFNNELTLFEDYREKVFNLIPSLKYLDGFDRNDVEDDGTDGESDQATTEEGKTAKVNGKKEGKDGSSESSNDSYEYDEVSGEDDEDSEDSEEFSEVGLQEVYNDNLEDDSNEVDYEAGETWEEEDEDIEEEEDEVAEQESPARGKKRKHEEGEGN